MIAINNWNCDSDSNYPDNNPIYVYDSSDEIWTTKEGKKLRVKDMTDNHVRNCYHIVKAVSNKYWMIVFKEELDKRGIKYE